MTEKEKDELIEEMDNLKKKKKEINTRIDDISYQLREDKIKKQKKEDYKYIGCCFKHKVPSPVGITYIKILDITEYPTCKILRVHRCYEAAHDSYGYHNMSIGFIDIVELNIFGKKNITLMDLPSPSILESDYNQITNEEFDKFFNEVIDLFHAVNTFKKE